MDPKVKYNLVNDPAYLVVHHAENRDDKIANDWNATVKFQKEVLGFIDGAYHWTWEYTNGTPHLHEGRPENAEGAHCWGFNSRSLGILIIGKFDLRKPPEDMLYIVASFCRSKQRRYHIPKKLVIGHRESYGILEGRGITIPERIHRKSCPGDMFDMDNFRERMLLDPRQNDFDEERIWRQFIS